MIQQDLKKGGIHQNREKLKTTGWHFVKNAGQYKNIWLNDSLSASVDFGVNGHRWVLFDNDNREWVLLNYSNGQKYGIRTISGLNAVLYKKNIKI